MTRRPPISTLFPSPPLSRSPALARRRQSRRGQQLDHRAVHVGFRLGAEQRRQGRPARRLQRSEEHTSELQSPCNLVCRLLLEKNITMPAHNHIAPHPLAATT